MTCWRDAQLSMGVKQFTGSLRTGGEKTLQPSPLLGLQANEGGRCARRAEEGSGRPRMVTAILHQVGVVTWISGEFGVRKG